MVRIICVIVATGAMVVACEQPRPREVDSRPPDTPSTNRPVPELSEEVLQGICLAHNWQEDGVDGYGTETSRETLAYLQSWGSTAVSITPFGGMADLHATEIEGEHNTSMPEGAETSRALRKVIEQAHELDFHVALKPHIWIHGGAWRGEIAPRAADGKPAWEAWWASYRAFILYYARIAERYDVETFVAGVELVSALEARPDAFRSMIEAIRSVYDGRITYATNWHGEVPDRVWRSLDSIGVQFYPPLTERIDPSDAELRASIREHLETWTRRAERLEMPLEILEVGYKSTPSAVRRPWGWPQNLSPSERSVDQQIQARAYRAFFQELSRLDRLHSVYIWKYFTDPTRDEGGKIGFSPRGKRAEEILKRAY